jgi:drug/metabolite transporter (DMT)-like permease
VVRRVASVASSPPHALAVLVGSALYGGITVGGRVFQQRGFSLLEISIMGGLFGAPMLLYWIWRQPEWRIRRRDWGFFAAVGVMGTLLQVSQFLSIVLGVPIAVVALLLYTQPVWTVVLGRVWLGEPITAQKLAALVLGAVGIVVLLGPTGNSGNHSIVGLGAAAVAGLMLSLWVIFGRMSALRGNHPVTTTFGYLATTAIGLLLLGAVMNLGAAPDPMWRLDLRVFAASWALVIGYTLLANVGPNVLVMWGMAGVEASIAGVLLLLEPLAAAALAWFLFGEAMTGNVWLGGALILGANAALLVRREQPASS